jgi:hypothetical protein
MAALLHRRARTPGTDFFSVLVTIHIPQVSTPLSMRCATFSVATGRNMMNRRTLTTMALLGLVVATALPQIGFAQSDPFVGTWQLNLAKSKYSPGPPPKSQTQTVQGDGQSHKFTITGTTAEGNAISMGLRAF